MVGQPEARTQTGLTRGIAGESMDAGCLAASLASRCLQVDETPEARLTLARHSLGGSQRPRPRGQVGSQVVLDPLRIR